VHELSDKKVKNFGWFLASGLLELLEKMGERMEVQWKEGWRDGEAEGRRERERG